MKTTVKSSVARRTKPATRKLTFEIPQEIYEILERMAEKSEQETEVLVMQWLASVSLPRTRKRTPAQRKRDRAELLSYAGTIRSGDPHSSDNERIDADLVREYGRTGGE